jgi:very-short-patch-repair endonuclease
VNAVREVFPSPAQAGEGGRRPDEGTIRSRRFAFAKGLRHGATEAESKLWTLLRSRRFSGFKFRRQRFIPPFIVDFCCVERRLIVELDGGQHVGSARDIERDGVLAKKGYRVLRYWNHQVLSGMEAVLEDILLHLRAVVPSSAPSGHLLPLKREKERHGS